MHWSPNVCLCIWKTSLCPLLPLTFAQLSPYPHLMDLTVHVTIQSLIYMACVTWRDKNKSILNENFNMEKKFFSIFIIHPSLYF